jgi:hypothetical protein
MSQPSAANFDHIVDALLGAAADGTSQRQAPSHDMLDGIARLWSEAGYAAPAALKSAYSEQGPAEALTEAPVDLLAVASDELSDVAAELDLASAQSQEDIARLRRRFAAANHPDAVAPALRDRAQRRMAIANALLDTARNRAERRA